MERVTQLVTRLQHICTSLGETAMSDGNLLWNKLSTIVVIGGQVRKLCQDGRTCVYGEDGDAVGKLGAGMLGALRELLRRSWACLFVRSFPSVPRPPSRCSHCTHVYHLAPSELGKVLGSRGRGGQGLPAPRHGHRHPQAAGAAACEDRQRRGVGRIPSLSGQEVVQLW